MVGPNQLRRGHFVSLLSIVLFFGIGLEPKASDEVVHVYAATSLTNAVEKIAEAFREETGVTVVSSFAGSSTLARQIERGAPADLFLSANIAWMDYLEARDLIEEGSRRPLLRNELVVVAPKGEGFEVEAEKGFDFALAFEGRLAVGDPSHVPAGIYARQALQGLGWWVGVKDRLAVGHDVRTTLVYVERGVCPAGIVYATDAALSSRIDVIARFPKEVSDPIEYPVAILKGKDRAMVKKFMTYLRSKSGRKIFQSFGFIVP